MFEFNRVLWRALLGDMLEMGVVRSPDLYEG